MKLYTVEITFSDFGYAVEQYEAKSPEHAVELFFTNAKCLQDYDRKEILSGIKNKHSDKISLLHVGDNLRGVWLFTVDSDFSGIKNEGSVEIYGGRVIQSDPHAPRRV